PADAAPRPTARPGGPAPEAASPVPDVRPHRRPARRAGPGLVRRGPRLRLEPGRPRRRLPRGQATGRPAGPDLPAGRLGLPGGTDQGAAQEAGHRQHRGPAHRHHDAAGRPAGRPTGAGLHPPGLLRRHPRPRAEQDQLCVRPRRCLAAGTHRRAEHRAAGRRLRRDRLRRLRERHRRRRRDPDVPAQGDQGCRQPPRPAEGLPGAQRHRRPGLRPDAQGRPARGPRPGGAPAGDAGGGRVEGRLPRHRAEPRPLLAALQRLGAGGAAGRGDVAVADGRAGPGHAQGRRWERADPHRASRGYRRLYLGRVGGALGPEEGRRRLRRDRPRGHRRARAVRPL
ncbi:MAG: Cell envelope-associated transcriptional attenuator LytR-CpsA-Psr, subfamily A1, partial [uncultured Friedmanniella sp.]